MPTDLPTLRQQQQHQTIPQWVDSADFYGATALHMKLNSNSYTRNSTL